MQEADIDKGEPGQPSRHEQQRGRNQFGRARARRGRLDDMVVVMAMVVVAMIVMRIRLMRGGMDDAGVCVDVSGAVAMRVVMVLDGVAARTARMRADQCDQARQDGAK